MNKQHIYIYIGLHIVLLTINIHVANSSSCKSNNEHTDIYVNYKLLHLNYTLYLPNTYITNIPNIDFNYLPIMCKILPNPGTNYRKFLNNNNITCTGSWCQNSTFTCKNTNNCYHVEHIIDNNDGCSLQDTKGMEKNILPNLIMAYSKWNQQIGQLKWKQVEIEKRDIYGDYIFNQAVYYIKECDKYLYPHKYISHGNNITLLLTIIVIIGCIFIVSVSIIIYRLYVSNKNNIANIEQHNSDVYILYNSNSSDSDENYI